MWSENQMVSIGTALCLPRLRSFLAYVFIKRPVSDHASFVERAQHHLEVKHSPAQESSERKRLSRSRRDVSSSDVDRSEKSLTDDNNESELAAAYAYFALRDKQSEQDREITTALPVGMREQDLLGLASLIPELQSLNDVSVKFDEEPLDTNSSSLFFEPLLERSSVADRVGNSSGS